MRAFEAEIAVHSDYFASNMQRVRDGVNTVLGRA
jgi:hypothetical protein